MNSFVICYVLDFIKLSFVLVVDIVLNHICILD